MKDLLRRASLKIANAPAMRVVPFGTDSLLLPPLAAPRLSESEPWMVETLGLLVRVFGAGLLDVGVNLGQTMAAYKQHAPQGSYIGLEPNPDCVSYARQFARANGFSDITIVPAALADRAGLIKLDFYQDTDADSSASIIPGFRPDRAVQRSEYITAITGAELAAQLDLSGIHIVKIDVEGAEALVLEALRDLLASARPVVTVEVLPAYSADNAARIGSQQAIEALLADTGYALFRIRHDKVTLFGFDRIDSFGIQTEIDASDHVLVPQERLADFESAGAARG